ncbi:unnamed protein product, partial [Brenthis ino]
MCCISELRKDSLPSALLSLLSAQRAQSQSLAALVPACLQVAPPALPTLPALPLDTLPDKLKTHLLQQAFLQNNNTVVGTQEERSSEPEYDDTDDIVLPEDSCAERKRASSSDEASRQFECRHCGKRYRWKSTLRRHENVECGGKAPAHQCPYCSYRAKQRGNLGVHIRKHHNQEWYVYASNKVRRNKKTSI